MMGRLTTLTRKWPTLERGGRLKVVRMMREISKRFGSMIPKESGLLGAVQKGSPRRMLD